MLISINDEIVHGIPGPRGWGRRHSVKLDVTVEKDGYVADAARSVIVGTGPRRRRSAWSACAEGGVRRRCGGAGGRCE